MKEIVDLLVNNGYEAYIVGGYVRDHILGIESKDIDICTNASIDTIVKLFKNKGVAYKQYYAYHIEENDYSYDITSFREELKYFNNKPIEIIPAKDLESDLKRRDFTINTLALDYNGNLIDIYGGLKDINNKVLRVVGNTTKKLEEDKTRIIRAIRFSCTLDFDLDSDIIKFISSDKISLLNEISKEYKRKELDKIFDCKNYHKFFKILNKYKLYEYFNIKNYNENNIKNVYNKYGIWALIDVDLPFSKKERYIIDNIKKIIRKGDIDVNDISYYEEDIIYNAACILNINEEIREFRNIVILDSIIDIDLSILLMIKYSYVGKFRETYKDIENKIIEGYLANDRIAIEEYLRNL